MAAVTGLRRPARLLNYYGHLSKVVVSNDTPREDCWYCKGIRGKRDEAEVERFLHLPHLLQPKE